jgi:hypothetical protein
VNVADDCKLLQIKPGQKDLKEATPLAFGDLKAGDRILVRGSASEDGKTIQAASLIAMKQADVAEKQVHERTEWQQHGIGGLVKIVDSAGGTITLTTSASGENKEVSVHAGKGTVLRRYAPSSIKFDEATPAPLNSIKAGDQLRARGQRSPDGKELAADEIVSGTFRNIAGILISADMAAATITVSDLATKQPITLKITADSQMRQIPLLVAQRIALRLKDTPAAGGQGGPSAPAAAKNAVESPPGPAAGAGPNGRSGGGDFQQMIARMPAASLSDLQKGRALMIVATEGSAESPSTVITLLGGVEPILQASPRGAQEMILSPWSLGAGGGEGATP